jgi:ELWxxDGT repeat protein
VFNNMLYFSADDGSTGVELWKSDGTADGTKRVKDINSGPGSGNLFGLTVFNGALYFSANGGMAGAELWKSDGTEGGTMQVKDINPLGDSSPRAFTVLNGALLFSADDGGTGRELWRTDGTEEGTMRVKDVCPGNCEGLPVPVPLAASAGRSLRSKR